MADVGDVRPVLVETARPRTRGDQWRSLTGSLLMWVVVGWPIAVLAVWLYTGWMVDKESLIDWKHDGMYPVLRALGGDHWGAWGGDSIPLMLPFGVMIQTLPVELMPYVPYDPVVLYRWVSIAPMLLMALAGVLVARRAAERRLWTGWRLHGLTVGAVAACCLNPVLGWAVYAGHPEEVAGCALLMLTLCVVDRRPVLAGALLALTVLCKQPFVLAVIPVLFASPRPLRTWLAMCLVGALVCLPYLLAAPDGFLALSNAGGQVSSVTLYNVWNNTCGTASLGADTPQDLRQVEGFCANVGTYSHYAIILLGIVLGLVGRLRRPAWADALPVDRAAALVICLFLMRSYLDPVNGPYYHLPAFGALLVYLGALRPQLPTSLFGAWLWIVLVGILVAPPIYSWGDPGINGVILTLYLCVVIPMSAWAAMRALGRAGRPNLV